MYFLIRWLIRKLRRPVAAPAEAPFASPEAAEAAFHARGERLVSPARPAASRGTSGATALSVCGLTKRFGDRVAFQDVSFEIMRGEVFGFLGPNGAGKTTTVRTLGTLIAPTSGSAMVAGIPLTPENGVEIRRRIAIMPELPGLYLRLSVAENLACFADLYEAADVGDHTDRALRAVNLADRAHDACGSLSKGLRQRVALARALLSDPEVLFLDEPTSGLDPVAARDVHELIDELRREEFLLGKALACFLPSVAVAYAVFLVFVACVELFAQPGVAPALLRGSDLLAQLLFTPLLAGWSIWVGIAISTRATEVRVAQQLGLVANLPSVLVTTLIAFNAIHPSLAIAIAGALVLLVLNRLGWSMTSAMFDRERLITGIR